MLSPGKGVRFLGIAAELHHGVKAVDFETLIAVAEVGRKHIDLGVAVRFTPPICRVVGPGRGLIRDEVRDGLRSENVWVGRVAGVVAGSRGRKLGLPAVRAGYCGHVAIAALRVELD